jgi:Fe2+ transport system protein FeoA
MNGIQPGTQIPIVPLPNLNDPVTLEEQEQQFLINQEAIEKVSRRLWKT